MLTIKQTLIDKMIAHAQREYPIEACGIIAGHKHSNRPARFIAFENAANSDCFFLFDSKQQLNVWREMEQNNEEAIVIYHSHTQSVAYPSPSDIEAAMEPQAHYVILSMVQNIDEVIRSFRIVNHKVTEERIHVVSDYSLGVTTSAHCSDSYSITST